MRNIIVINDFGFINGGAAKVAISNALELADRGIQVIFFTALGPIDPRLNQHQNINVINTNQRDILNEGCRYKAILQGLYNIKSARYMKNVLSGLDQNETIIHIHGFTKALSISPIIVALLKKYSVVFTVHDYFIVCPNGAFFLYN
ncbi:MAG: glycosyltransferase family 4 protein, partial [Crenarchaeota archaeon]|nr:glycosyltransferase family 4 protein [Thermoproteota archaeon]